MACVLLVIPYKNSRNYTAHQPLGAMYLATALLRRGDTVRICDLRLHHKEKSYFEETLNEVNPDALGVSAMAYQADSALSLCIQAKRIRPGLITMIGGPATGSFESILKENPAVDYVCQGEGEETLPELIAALASGNRNPDIPGVSYRSQKNAGKPAQILSRPLDSYGHPAWDLIDVERYFDFPRSGQFFAFREYMSIFTSRGCPFNCVYCHNIFGKRFRARTAEHVLEELTLLRRQYGIREIMISDDTFNFDRNRLLKISEMVCRADLDLKFNIVNGLRTDCADREILGALKAMGTYKIGVAIETGSARLQKVLCRNADLEKVRQFIDDAEAAGIITTGFFILGIPGESREEVRKSVDFALDSKLHLASFNILNPYPGTRAFELWGSPFDCFKRITQNFDFLSAVNQVSDIPTATLSRIRFRANLRFYFCLRRILSIIHRIPKKRHLFSSAWLLFKRMTVWA